MALPRTLHAESGSLIIEAAVALALGALVFVGAMTFVMEEQRTVESAVERRRALFAARRALEEARAAGQLGAIATTTDKDGVNVALSVENSTECTQKLTASTTFGLNTLMFETIVASTSYANAVSGDCGGEIFFRDFVTPVSSHYPIISDPTTAFGAFDVIAGNIAVAENSASTSTIRIFNYNASGGLAPKGSLTLQAPVLTLDATTDYIFVGTEGTSSQMKVVDWKNRTALELSVEVSLPGVAGSFPGALSVRYFDGFVFVGIHRTAGREFHVYEMSGAAPSWRGALELNHNINDIVIRKPYAYLATSGNLKDLIVLDISNSSSPSIAATLDIPGTEDSTSLHLTGTTLALGRKKSTKAVDQDFVLIDISNPLTPLVQNGATIKEEVRGIHRMGPHFFLATDGPTARMRALSLNSSSTDLTTTYSADLPEPAVAADFDHGTFFILLSHALAIFSFK